MSWDNVQFQTIYGIMAAVLGAWLILGLVLFFKQDRALKQLKAATEAQLQQLQILKNILKSLTLYGHAVSNHLGLDLGVYLNQELEAESQENANSNQFMQSAMPFNNKIYVGNMDYKTTEEELTSIFSKFGQIEFINIPVNKYTGRTRGYGFVSFSSEEEAQKATSLNGLEFKGRNLQVSFAKEKII